MNSQEIIILLGVVVSMVGLLTMLIKFVVDRVFAGLQAQITDLQTSGERREQEIIQLRGVIDEWQEKYYNLQVEHTALQSKHEHLQCNFDKLEARTVKG